MNLSRRSEMDHTALKVPKTSDHLRRIHALFVVLLPPSGGSRSNFSTSAVFYTTLAVKSRTIKCLENELQCPSYHTLPTEMDLHEAAESRRVVRHTFRALKLHSLYCGRADEMQYYTFSCVLSSSFLIQCFLCDRIE